MFEWRCCTPRLSAAAVACLPTAPVGLFLASMPLLDMGYPAHESVMTSRLCESISRTTVKPEIEVQPSLTAATGFHSGRRRASSGITRYVPFGNANRHSHAPPSVLCHKITNDTKGSLCGSREILCQGARPQRENVDSAIRLAHVRSAPVMS